ncbi:hypothetical protein GCM10010919_11570 [Alishewanella longhuensis]|uniref:DUF3192 domain-containing protein n=1 Tax=Alishewanella longhuensis TaxID=1091037 RepID=A0ABQ3KW02_9ALTE|nr:DUF3192 domain-containing protein [Alishewanella longhuensis]GHG64750.1 hypothetical protein GCM10010919_11570 [Alishewanella longhuensis]
MKIKILLWLVVGIGIYLLATIVILRFYPDNPAQMNWQDREAFNAKFIQRLNLSKPVQQEYLINRLGSPDITEAYRHNGEVYQLLYYRTHRKAADGITTADECTALLFIERQLSAVGDEAIARYLELQPDARSLE